MRDELNGTIVCTSCGLVVEEGILDLTGGTRSSLHEERQAGRASTLCVKRGDERLVREVEEKERKRIRRRLAARLGAEHAEDVKKLVVISEKLSLAALSEINKLAMLVEQLAGRKTARMKLALAHALYLYRAGRYPDLRHLARQYEVNLTRLRRSFRELLLKMREEPHGRLVSEIRA